MKLLTAIVLLASVAFAAPAPNPVRPIAPTRVARALDARAPTKVAVAPHFPISEAAIASRPNTVQNELVFDAGVGGCTKFIPFKNTAGTESFPDFSAPRVLIAVDGVNIYSKGVLVDTGSTGFTIGQNTWTTTFAKNWGTTDKSTPGWKYLSSSKKLYQGYWVTVDITFKDLSWNPLLQSHTQVLVYDKVLYCPGYLNSDNGVCQDENAPEETNPTGAYMGIGYGRRSDGMLESTPDRNPLLTITFIWKEGAGCIYRNGYTITRTGLTWGLTAANTAGYRWRSLVKESAEPMDWAMPDACIRVGPLNDLTINPCRPGKYLPDTGVDQMYISHPDIVSNGNLGGAITVRVAEAAPAVGMGEFVYSGTSPSGNIQPAQIFSTKSVSRVYVNTGSHLWNGWMTGFDADEGYQGLREIV